MGLFSSKNENDRELANAREDLERVSARDGAETDAYLAANQRVAEAEQHASWWKR